jgi:hypothetical protein
LGYQELVAVAPSECQRATAADLERVICEIKAASEIFGTRKGHPPEFLISVNALGALLAVD